MAGYAFVFPGQASQYVGMAQDLYEKREAARRLFARADQVLGFSLSRVCFAGPEEELRQTAVTQPAVLVHSAAAGHLLMEAGLEPMAVAGHSLGEYSALVAAGALDFAEALEVVAQRGRLMQEAGERQPGAMAAIIGLEDGQVEELWARDDMAGRVVVANLNAPGQVVISGDTEAVKRVGEWAREEGARRVVELAVSGAFHSPLMEPAARQLESALRAVPLRQPRVPVVTNVAAQPVQDPEELRSQLIRQLTHPVRWIESVQCLVGLGATCMVEVGPGAVLKGLVRRIAPQVEVLNAGTVEEIESAMAALKGRA
jgi:[acyl-carrier-protein] S-malonyltransferase